MRLKRLIYSNYRSFGSEETSININDLTAFIGENSSGKTTILTGLQKLFGNDRVEKSDFHVPLNKKADEISENTFYIEAYFEFFHTNDSDAEDYAIPSYFENFVVNEPEGRPYIGIRLDARYEKGNTPEGIIETDFSYVMNKDEKELKTIPKRDRSKIQAMYIPAVRDPINQLRNASGTILWRILNQINWKETDIESINSKIDEVDIEISEQSGIATVQQIISNQWKNYHDDDRYSETNIKFGSNNLDNILKKLEVEFTPTHTDKEFKVEDLGDGLKSLFYLTLINTLLELENIAIQEKNSDTPLEDQTLNIEPPALTLVLVEEPENHVSPHLLGKVLENLNSIRDRPNSQVLITSHSPSIIKRIEPEQIRHLRIENGKSIVNEILLPPEQEDEYKYVKNAVKAYPELYFSSLVILGEGDSEEILIPKFLNLHMNELDTIGISVVPLGGRHVNHFWKLLNQLEIPHITLLDLDIERDGGGWGRIKYVLNQLTSVASKFYCFNA